MPVYSVTQSCSTLCHPMDCSPPGFSVHGNFQAGILELVATFFLQGICHRLQNKTQDHQLRIGRSKNQERLTKICLDSPGRWTGTRDFCWSQVSRSLQSSGKRGVCSGPPLWLSKLSTGKKKKHKVKAVSSVLFGDLLRTIAGRYPQA